ncbi:helix-turn-helix domain-containing protein [Actinomadura bangladeshensis]|uniref:XRE family transcriptional regulator n=1 Tax=Actinomadura bangladeshensis TaxID=453573 RepID=A0A4R4NVD9_9ACTN|nr:helix-turn-helix domain-containing protein [Actinomadura bangladeshensis]TDC13409.1 XRE family transcriptional regulator [Actinomadura bangladeshensis]
MHQAPNLPTLLRAWRARLQPADVGLPFGRHSRRTPGLRREEVAWLAGVSTDYVKRLEQGRAHPSGAVLRALSRTLRLSDEEYELACRLAGHAVERGGGQVPRHLAPSVRRLLDRLNDNPIAVFDATWTLLERNHLWAALTGDPRGHDGRPVNIVRLAFQGGPGRVRHASPQEYRQSLVADLRGAAARYPRDRELADLISELRRSSPEFAQLWAGSAVAHHGNESKTVVHPELGEFELDCDVLTVHGADLRLVVYTASPGSDGADKLRSLTVLAAEVLSAT